MPRGEVYSQLMKELTEGKYVFTGELKSKKRLVWSASISSGVLTGIVWRFYPTCSALVYWG